ncbi:C6 transcription factor [Colletotrichum higginsianum IMI 349063]|uniref:C6 transcription factor n=3 Tax=Colletotrichum higginsianum TaxID=80884 RepID=A0A1B7YQF1_COLHI|nr:C6 transcription factor [Colletotrichum higginsianum IMI 349063]OBR14267.1 C6 transcription factor [Colletotrichum higginsianum IMI 349063]
MDPPTSRIPFWKSEAPFQRPPASLKKKKPYTAQTHRPHSIASEEYQDRGPPTMPEHRSPTSPDTTPPSLRFVNNSAQPEPRKKVAHRKSRGGCAPCKKRKVKCDEVFPCSNCLRRNETCAPPPKPASPEDGDRPPARRPLDTSGPVNLLHMELFHHFQHATIPTLCFADLWPSVVPLAFGDDYLMTAMLAVAARHLSILRPHETAYADAAMALLSRSCALFGAVLDRGDDKYDPLFFTAQLIHYLAWCNLDFLPDGGDAAAPGSPALDLSRDRLFLLGSGVRVFLSSARAHGSGSIFAQAWQNSQCGALELIVAEQGMDRDSIVEGFMERYDELGRGAGCAAQDGEERASFRSIVDLLSVVLALWEYRETNTRPAGRPDLERHILAFPLFCFGPFLDMVVANDSRALLVLYHFYTVSRLLLGAGAAWWASGRLETMSRSIKQELARRGLGTRVRGLGS